jgi:hypothetical protein
MPGLFAADERMPEGIRAGADVLGFAGVSGYLAGIAAGKYLNKSW